MLIKIKFLFLLLTLFLLSGCFASQPSIMINEKIIKVEIAKTPSQRYSGLSGRQSLAEDRGMLFVYEAPTQPFFVMRKMNFPLDIVWIANDKIIQIDENLPPDKENEEIFYQPVHPIDYVLEMNAGSAKTFNFKVGDNVIFNIN